MSDEAHEGGSVEATVAPDPPGPAEPLPPGCMGLVFAGLAAIGLSVALYAWMEAAARTNTILAAYATGMASAAIIGVGIIVVPIVSLVLFFVGRAYGSRRLMAFRMDREVAEAEREAAARGAGQAAVSGMATQGDGRSSPGAP